MATTSKPNHGLPVSSEPAIAPAELALSAAADHILSGFDTKHAIDDTPTASRTTAIEATTSKDDPSIDQTPEPQEHRSKTRLAFILLALFLSLFVAALDATIVATAVPVIAHELNSATGYIWIGAAYLLAHAAASPIWAKLSDIWGRKIVILILLVIFFAASAICATASTMNILIAGRALQGVAGGGLLLLVHIVISDLFSVRLRSLLIGVTESIWAVAGGLGPPLGGVFASLVSWRWCFYINLPICGLAFLLILLFLDVKHEKTSLRTGLAAIDWFGITSFLACTLMVLLGLDFGGNVFAWSSAKVITLLVVGTAMLAVFLYSEAKLAKHPLIPLSLFKDKSNLASLAVTFFHGLGFIPAEYYTPLYYQAVKNSTPLQSGILLIPLIVATALTGILTGIIIHQTGHYRELIWTGTIILTLSLALLTQIDAHTSTGEAIGLTVLLGIGSGLLFEPPLIAIQSRTPQHMVATATSTFNFIRSLAIATSVILGGAIFQNSMDVQSRRLAATNNPNLPQNVTQALTGRYAAANVGLAGTLSDPTAREEVQMAFAWSMRNMWIGYAALSALGLVAGLFVGSRVLSTEHTETVTGIRGADGEERKDGAGAVGVEMA